MENSFHGSRPSTAAALDANRRQLHSVRPSTANAAAALDAKTKRERAVKYGNEQSYEPVRTQARAREAAAKAKIDAQLERQQLKRCFDEFTDEERRHRTSVLGREEDEQLELMALERREFKLVALLCSEASGRQSISGRERRGVLQLAKQHRRVRKCLSESRSRADVSKDEADARYHLTLRYNFFKQFALVHFNEESMREDIVLLEVKTFQRFVDHATNTIERLSAFGSQRDELRRKESHVRVEVVDALAERHEALLDDVAQRIQYMMEIEAAKRACAKDEGAARDGAILDWQKGLDDLRVWMREDRSAVIDGIEIRAEARANFEAAVHDDRDALAHREQQQRRAIWSRLQEEADAIREWRVDLSDERAAFVADTVEILANIEDRENLQRRHILRDMAEDRDARSNWQRRKELQREKFLGRVKERVIAVQDAEATARARLRQRRTEEGIVVAALAAQLADDTRAVSAEEKTARFAIFDAFCRSLDALVDHMDDEAHALDAWCHERGHVRSRFEAAELDSRRSVAEDETAEREWLKDALSDGADRVQRAIRNMADDRSSLAREATAVLERIDLDETVAWADLCRFFADSGDAAVRRQHMRELFEVSAVEEERRHFLSHAEERARSDVADVLDSATRRLGDAARRHRQRTLNFLLEDEERARERVEDEQTTCFRSIVSDEGAEMEVTRKQVAERERQELLDRQAMMLEDERALFMDPLDPELAAADAETYDEEPPVVGRGSYSAFRSSGGSASNAPSAYFQSDTLTLQRDFVCAELSVVSEQVQRAAPSQVASIAHLLDVMAMAESEAQDKLHTAERKLKEQEKRIQRKVATLRGKQEAVEGYTSMLDRRQREFEAREAANAGRIRTLRETERSRAAKVRETQTTIISMRNHSEDLSVSIDDLCRARAGDSRQVTSRPTRSLNGGLRR